MTLAGKLKSIRKQAGMSQEQLAEKLNVSGRTVSRWETGSNMPDIGMLVEMADFFDVSIPEIVSGERKSENMNQETKETAAAMAKYSKNEVKNEKQIKPADKKRQTKTTEREKYPCRWFKL